MAFAYEGTESNGSVDGKLKIYPVNSGHSGVLGPGDLVLITGDGDAKGRTEVDIGTENGANTGVIDFVGVNIAGEALSQTHLSATTAGFVHVNVDGGALYDVPVSNGPITDAEVGQNAPAIVTAGTVSSNVFTSNMGINATGIATTSTLPFRIVERREDSAGVLGNRALVRVNESTSQLGATGIS